MNVAGPPGFLIDAIRAGVDGLKFVVTVVVGDEAGAVEKDVGGGRPARVVVIVPALGVGLPDIEHGIAQRPARVETKNPAADEQHGPRFQWRRYFSPEGCSRPMEGPEDVVLSDGPGSGPRAPFLLRFFLGVSGIGAQSAAGFGGQGICSQNEPGLAGRGQAEAAPLDKIPSRKKIHRPLLL